MLGCTDSVEAGEVGCGVPRPVDGVEAGEVGCSVPRPADGVQADEVGRGVEATGDVVERPQIRAAAYTESVSWALLDGFQILQRLLDCSLHFRVFYFYKRP
jgi:hypothetical protein